MAAYIVATVTNVTDPVKFGDYVKAIAGLAERFGGEYVVRGKVTEALEGDIDPKESVVVIRFPDADAALQYAKGPDYQAGKALRQGTGTVETRLIVDPA